MNTIDWCKAEIETATAQIALIDDGSMQSHWRAGNGPLIDTTARMREHYAQVVTNMQAMIGEIESEEGGAPLA